jgi:hypothetical protein
MRGVDEPRPGTIRAVLRDAHGGVQLGHGWPGQRVRALTESMGAKGQAPAPFGRHQPLR